MVPDQADLTAAPSSFSIDKRSNLSQADLIKEYIEPSIPVVLTDATRNWKAMNKFTPQYFKQNYPNLSKTIAGETYKMADVIDMILEENPERKAPYPFNFNMQKFLPELLPDLTPEILFSKSDRINNPLTLPKVLLHGTTPYEIFFGGKGAFFPFLHVDALSLHTQITQIYGAKDFIMYPPNQKSLMYPSDENQNFSQVDIFNPDFEKYPLFKDAKPVRVTVNQGETIIFPTGWWHSTQIHEPCISFGRTHLNAANWDNFINDNYRALKRRISYFALPLLAYGKLAGNLIDKQEKSN